MFVGTSTKKGTKSKIKEISLSILKQSKVESFRVQSMSLKKRTDGLKKKVKSVKSHLQWYQQERTDGRATTFTSYCAKDKLSLEGWSQQKWNMHKFFVDLVLLFYSNASLSQVYWKELILLVHCARGQMQNCPKCRSNAYPHSQKSPIDIINPVSLTIR